MPDEGLYHRRIVIQNGIYECSAPIGVTCIDVSSTRNETLNNGFIILRSGDHKSGHALFRSTSYSSIHFSAMINQHIDHS